jgi:hypothetical protein
LIDPQPPEGWCLPSDGGQLPGRREAEDYMGVEVKDPGDQYEDALAGWDHVRDRPRDKSSRSTRQRFAVP